MTTSSSRSTAERLRVAVQSCATAFCEFWQGYWDRPIGC